MYLATDKQLAKAEIAKLIAAGCPAVYYYEEAAGQNRAASVEDAKARLLALGLPQDTPVLFR